MEKLFKYVLVGGSAAIINWIVFFVCVEICALHYLGGGFLAFIVATLWNFILARKFIFTPKHSLLKESALIYLVSFAGLCIDILVLYVCVDVLKIPAMVGKIFASGVAFLFNFNVRNFVIYKN
ncbi:GtrA family protein [Helicobacter sp. 23-1045]